MELRGLELLISSVVNLPIRRGLISGDDGYLYNESCALPRSIHGVYAATVAFKYAAAYAQA